MMSAAELEEFRLMDEKSEKTEYAFPEKSSKERLIDANQLILDAEFVRKYYEVDPDEKYYSPNHLKQIALMAPVYKPVHHTAMWIPASVKPKRHDTYLVTISHDNYTGVIISMWSTAFNRWYWIGSGGTPEEQKFVKAWMEIPDPYEEEKK